MKRALGLLSALLLCFGMAHGQTALQTGDMAIVTFNSDGGDSIGILTFVQLDPGTQFLLTDNGFERGAPPGAYTWGNSEEVTQITVTSMVPAGTVISYKQGTILPAGSFTQTKIAGFSSSFIDQYTTSGDGVFILQGTWINGTVGFSNATFTGTYVWGFNSTPWTPTTGTPSGTAASRLPPELACANLDFPHQDNWQYLNTAPKTGPKPTIIANIRNAANWQSNNTTPYNITTGPFTVTPGTITATWTGAADTDWFNCQNWSTFVVPDMNTNVIFPTTSALNDCVLQAGDTARCNDIDFTETGGFALRAEGDVTKVLEVHGDLDILTTSGSNGLDFDDGLAGTDDGHIYLYGNWNNAAGAADFLEGESTIHFVGGTAQSVAVSPSTTEVFGSFVINKTANDVNLMNFVEVNDTLNLVAGRVITGVTTYIHTTDPSTGVVIGNPLNSWVFGTLLRNTQPIGGLFDFPVGDAVQAQIAQVDLTAGHGVVTLGATFSNAIPGAQPNVNESGVLYDQMLNGGIWTIQPISGTLGTTYTLHLYERGYTNGGGQYINVKRPNSAGAWANDGTHVTYSEIGGTVYCARTALTAFSEFGIATRVLPVTLNYFEGEVVNDDEVRLDWDVASELNVEEYVVQRVEGEDFIEIGRLDAQGPQQYTLYDLHPLTGRNEYRLMEFTLNGELVEISRTEVYLDEMAAQWSVYPNPFQTEVHIVSNDPDLELRVMMSGVDGKVLFQSQGNAASMNTQLESFSSQLPAGVYLLSIQGGKSRLVEKLIKQ